MVKLTIRRVGNSLGVTLPVEALRALRVGEGDSLYLTETPDGFQVVAHDPEFEESMQVAEDFMKRYRNTLRELSKCTIGDGSRSPSSSRSTPGFSRSTEGQAVFATEDSSIRLWRARGTERPMSHASTSSISLRPMPST